MKIALVDDEQIYLEKMAEICREFAAENRIDIEIDSYGDGDSFIRSAKEYPIVFMDIYMNGSSGILTAQQLRKRSHGCILIFMTTSSEHMPEAFSCHAFEYIVKPFSAQRVKKVLSDSLRLLPAETEYTELYSEGKIIRVALDRIVYIMSDAHYLSVELSDSTSIRCRMTTRQFLEQVNFDERFLLVNKGVIVNADYVTDFENNCCILENGIRLPIRVRDRLVIEQTVRNYNFDKIRKNNGTTDRRTYDLKRMAQRVFTGVGIDTVGIVVLSASKKSSEDVGGKALRALLRRADTARRGGGFYFGAVRV